MCERSPKSYRSKEIYPRKIQSDKARPQCPSPTDAEAPEATRADAQSQSAVAVRAWPPLRKDSVRKKIRRLAPSLITGWDSLTTIIAASHRQDPLLAQLGLRTSI